MSDPILHIVKPNVAAPFGSTPQAPMNVLIQSPILLQLIESIYHDNNNDDTKTRTIGTLLGTRSDDGCELEIKECYVVPHKEEDDELTIEEAHHISSYQLYKRVNPELQIVGWFSTNPVLDTFTGLVHEFYSKGSCFPNQPIHLTLQSKSEITGEVITPIIKTYISSPIGLPANSSLTNQLGLDKVGTFAFTPIPNSVAISKSELTTLKFLNLASKDESRSVDISRYDELKQLSSSVNQITKLLDSLKSYVDKVISGEIEGDSEIAKTLLSNLNFKPNSIDLDTLNTMFENHTNDTLLVEYLASCVKQQLDLSSKLTTFVSSEEAAN
ncbi:hypothetical protein CANARDRAFT_17530 [[Candida] arabinofermentans NRRL YB-2248]|uniref:MPN domain-containing protein n=1 Tax=[Candida] arabinofermentans NRRL YB-2248 TaxID=983967 RepID=A0A1E4T1A6_9ASCO|nr:hypothetical protein CANARDRAFT_17530 [[Candida] arabinofermentans NRRL YB-2248]